MNISDKENSMDYNLKEVDLEAITSVFSARLSWLCDLTHVTLRDISDNTRLDYKDLHKIKLKALTPTIKIIETISNYFTVSSDFLLGLTNKVDFSEIEAFQPDSDYFCAAIDGIQFDDIMNSVIQPVCHILSQLREDVGITKIQLSNIFNVSPKIISKWETGYTYENYPTLEQFIQLADFYDTTIDYLLGQVMHYDDLYGIDFDFSAQKIEYITPEERAAGATATKKISITPIEDEMLYTFREIGKKHGEQAQRALITVAEKML